MLRRIKSCPANICNMIHRKKPTKKETCFNRGFIIPVKETKIIKKGDCINEIIISSLGDANINDPTQQLVFTVMFNKLLSKQKTDFSTLLYEIFIRSIISFSTHKIMAVAYIYIENYYITK